ncbi:hypothetical protein OTU49_012966, partial [Cherax quadricarinatus]
VEVRSSAPPSPPHYTTPQHHTGQSVTQKMENCPSSPSSCYSIVNIQNCHRENGMTGLVSAGEITMKIENVAEENFIQECLAINELENDDDLADIKKDIEESDKDSNDENIGEGSNNRRGLRRKKS